MLACERKTTEQFPLDTGWLAGSEGFTVKFRKGMTNKFMNRSWARHPFLGSRVVSFRSPYETARGLLLND